VELPLKRLLHLKHDSILPYDESRLTEPGSLLQLQSSNDFSPFVCADVDPCTGCCLV